jgi:hypothetical protein
MSSGGLELLEQWFEDDQPANTGDIKHSGRDVGFHFKL